MERPAMATEVTSKNSDRKRRVLTVLRTVGYFLLVPCIFLGLVPWWMSRWRLEAPLLGFGGFRLLGGLLMAAGIFVFLDSYGRDLCFKAEAARLLRYFLRGGLW